MSRFQHHVLKCDGCNVVVEVDSQAELGIYDSNAIVWRNPGVSGWIGVDGCNTAADADSDGAVDFCARCSRIFMSNLASMLRNGIGSQIKPSEKP